MNAQRSDLNVRPHRQGGARHRRQRRHRPRHGAGAALRSRRPGRGRGAQCAAEVGRCRRGASEGARQGDSFTLAVGATDEGRAVAGRCSTQRCRARWRPARHPRSTTPAPRCASRSISCRWPSGNTRWTTKPRRAAFLSSRAAHPHLKAAGALGKIINIGSMMSTFGAPCAPAYRASKGGDRAADPRDGRTVGRRRHPGQCGATGLDPDRPDRRRARPGCAGLNERVIARTAADAGASRTTWRASQCSRQRGIRP